jgi:ABC-type multidrug transport system ATPase subunit
MRRINKLIASFGLESQANTLVGTPIRKGISGGQKRRLSVASQLITAPKILFMDEPTSGLDSAASFEVVSFVKEVAKKHNVCRIFLLHRADHGPYDVSHSCSSLRVFTSHRQRRLSYSTS